MISAIISALAVFVGIILIVILVTINNSKVEDQLIEIKLQLDEQEAKMNSILSQLRELKRDNEVIDHNIHLIIGSISNLKDELK